MDISCKCLKDANVATHVVLHSSGSSILASHTGGLRDSQDDQCEMCDKLGLPPSISSDYTTTY